MLIDRQKTMADLVFDIEKSYEQNIEALRQYAAIIDRSMADILFQHLDKLMVGEDPGSRTNRTTFNRAVLTDLEASILGEVP